MQRYFKGKCKRNRKLQDASGKRTIYAQDGRKVRVAGSVAGHALVSAAVLGVQ